jgi:hypothetical protein
MSLPRTGHISLPVLSKEKLHYNIFKGLSLSLLYTTAIVISKCVQTCKETISNLAFILKKSGNLTVKYVKTFITKIVNSK